jgi:hypothetical protein
MTIKNTKKTGVMPNFHTIRINSAAFAKLHKKRVEAMEAGRRVTVSEIANTVIMGE